MEERLDDAINVLRNHAEQQVLGGGPLSGYQIPNVHTHPHQNSQLQPQPQSNEYDGTQATITTIPTAAVIKNAIAETTNRITNTSK